MKIEQYFADSTKVSKPCSYPWKSKIGSMRIIIGPLSVQPQHEYLAILKSLIKYKLKSIFQLNSTGIVT
jgi:hypothetical protein